jgi:hypothetical protein
MPEKQPARRSAGCASAAMAITIANAAALPAEYIYIHDATKRRRAQARFV